MIKVLQYETLDMLYFSNGHKTIEFAASQHEKKKSSSMSIIYINRLFIKFEEIKICNAESVRQKILKWRTR